jgi:hypothetical protein
MAHIVKRHMNETVLTMENLSPHPGFQKNIQRTLSFITTLAVCEVGTTSSHLLLLFMLTIHFL